jgi:hypothetical protein
VAIDRLPLFSAASAAVASLLSIAFAVFIFYFFLFFFSLSLNRVLALALTPIPYLTMCGNIAKSFLFVCKCVDMEDDNQIDKTLL